MLCGGPGCAGPGGAAGTGTGTGTGTGDGNDADTDEKFPNPLAANGAAPARACPLAHNGARRDMRLSPRHWLAGMAAPKVEETKAKAVVKKDDMVRLMARL